MHNFSSRYYHWARSKGVLSSPSPQIPSQLIAAAAASQGDLQYLQSSLHHSRPYVQYQVPPAEAAGGSGGSGCLQTQRGGAGGGGGGAHRGQGQAGGFQQSLC